MKVRIGFCVLGLLMTVLVGKAQTENEAIQKTIMTLFDGMRKGDSAMVHPAFAKDAIMQTIANNREGQVQVQSGNLTDFLKAVGTPHAEVWDERIEFGDIKVDGPMASVWTPYQFFRGENFSHCGVNSFQLYKSEKGWKIIYLVDTRSRDDCK
ncbi:MAG: hypothetical protein COW03_17695 [Cytophagales bacterium CG12_big_fil_rev_8_21_14_0_65_40_12]|nr:MAG: hypothetical protein COW03_17695 [Cytophagales bacterium CG12_big_fil_rev_8_21_14_0_65_40_12]PIW06162.1 MAG: hypothetical protein COW40_01110 [Cytophagales bacterium CG17_big_fil_post_rev_8_21_14_2_50_40_13]